MATLLNVHLNPKKSLYIELTKIFGIGRSTSRLICTTLNIDKEKKIKDLTVEEEDYLSNYIEEKLSLPVGDQLKKLLSEGFKREEATKSNRWYRRMNGLPVNGGRTRANGKTAEKFKGKI